MQFFAEFNFQAVATVTMILFAVIDIVGSIPLIIQIKQKAGEIHPLKATIVALCIMVLFLFLGKEILGLIGITVESFAVAGSFILFAMAIEMILGVTLFKEDGPPKTASIVPLAFPIIAGAGTMTSLLSLRAEFATINILIGILINMIIVWVTLQLTARIEKMLGQGGIAIIRKVFGIILLAIAVKLFSSNAKILFS
jgi:multiple antibiotic resistance protein